MSKCKSCIGCKFLYGDGQGYSNYTWMDTFMVCALGLSEKLRSGEVQKQYSYHEAQQMNLENLSDDKNQELINYVGERCNMFSPGPFIELVPDRDEDYREECIDEDQYVAIKHSDE